MSALRVAALQVEIAWEQPEESFRHLEPWIRSAAEAGARLVVLPEMFACGFTMNTAAVAEPHGGPSARFLAEQARAHGLWLAGSFPELASAGGTVDGDAGGAPDDRRPANTLLLAGPDGQEHRYRKIKPFRYAGEHRHYRAGDAALTVDVEGVRVTPFICYDLRFADLFWQRAEATDLYLVVANWPLTRRRHWTALLTARAIENQAYVMGVNRVGEGGGLAYTGDSRIVDPLGEELAAAALGETMLLADVDPARVRRVRDELPFLRDR